MMVLISLEGRTPCWRVRNTLRMRGMVRDAMMSTIRGFFRSVVDQSFEVIFDYCNEVDF